MLESILISLVLIRAQPLLANEYPDTDPHTPWYQDSPVFIAELTEIKGKGLQSCESLRGELSSAESIRRQIRPRLQELNSLLEAGNSASQARIERLYRELEELHARFAETYPFHADDRSLTARFVTTIPTLWFKLSEDYRRLPTHQRPRLDESLVIDQVLLPEVRVDHYNYKLSAEAGTMDSIPPSISGGNNYFMGPRNTLTYAFVRTVSLIDLCVKQEPMTLSIRRTVHSYHDYSDGPYLAEEKALIQGSYAGLKKTIRNALASHE